MDSTGAHPTPQTFEQIFVFGDSLSDTGAIFALSQALTGFGAPSEVFGYNSNYTNLEAFGDGAMWVDTALTPMLSETGALLNFAVGGARARGASTALNELERRDLDALIQDPRVLAEIRTSFGGETLDAAALAQLPPEIQKSFAVVNDTWLTGQVENASPFLNDVSDSSLAVFLIGGNDFNSFGAGAQTVEDFAEEMAASVLAGAARMASGGIGQLVFVTQPSFTFAPVSLLLAENLVNDISGRLIAEGASLEAARAEAEAQAAQRLSDFDAIARAYNAVASSGFSDLSQTSGTPYTIVDLAKLADVIDEDVSSFGLADVEAGRILNTGTESLPFLDRNQDGRPDLEVDETGAVLRDFDGPFLPADTDGDGAFDVFVRVDPVSLPYDLDELAFYDGFHPTAALHDIIAAFFSATLEDAVRMFEADGSRIRLTSDRDVAFARGGDDHVRAYSGDDVVFAGLGDDFVNGGAGGDVLVGGAGDDELRGGVGDDVLAGSNGDDLLQGGAGRDLIVDGAGDDISRGAWGDDVFIFEIDPDQTAKDRINGGRGEDLLVLRVDSALFDAAAQDFAEFESGQRTTVTIAETQLRILNIEQVVLISDDGGVDAQIAYETALQRIVEANNETFATAVAWNIVDPVFS